MEHHSNYTAVKDVMCPCMDKIFNHLDELFFPGGKQV